MAVDLLRSCYSTQMQFYDDPTKVANVSWYFVPDGTPFLPYPTPFNSLNWEADPRGGRPRGEVLGAPRPWRNGSKVGSAPGTGPPCGTADQWLNGIPNPVPVPLTRDGTPCCCFGLPSKAADYFGCSACSCGARAAYHFDTGNLAPACGFFQGTWTVSNPVGCQWFSAPIPFVNPPLASPATWTLSVGVVDPLTTQILLQLNDANGFQMVQYGFTGAWDCLRAQPLLLNSSGIACFWPASITLQPGPAN